MGVISSLIRPIKEDLKYRLRWRYLWRDWFLGRHACLGYDVLKYYENLPVEVNFQKGRADLLVNYWNKVTPPPKSSRLVSMMARQDVLPLIHQLGYFKCLPKTPPKFIFMDSFAELTDQLFMNALEKWQFCCGYSDIDHNENFNSMYMGLGLLPLQDLQKSYENLFNFFEARWGKVPIYFLHFPIALEKREVFIERYNAIVEVIQSIAESRSHIHSVKIDESRVAWPKDLPEDLRLFPYHYDDATYRMFKEKIDSTL